MRARKGYIPVDTMFPHMGLNTTTPATMLDPAFSPNCAEVTFQDGAIRKRTGYRRLGGLFNVKSVVTSGTSFFPMAVWWQGLQNIEDWVINRGVNVLIWDTRMHSQMGDWEAMHQKVEALRLAGHVVWVIRHPAYLLQPELANGTPLDINFDLKWMKHILAFNLDDELEDKVPGGGGGNVLFAPAVITAYIKQQVAAYQNWYQGCKIFVNWNGTHINSSTIATYTTWMNSGIDIGCSDSYPADNQQTFVATSAKLYPSINGEMINGLTLLKAAVPAKKIWAFAEVCNQLQHIAGDPGWAPGYVFDGSRSPTTTELNTFNTNLHSQSGDGIAWFPQSGGGTTMDATNPALLATMVSISVANQPAPSSSTTFPVAESVIGVINFQDSNDVQHLIAVTTHHRFEYDPGTVSWTDITGATVWTGDETNRLSWVVAQGTDVSGYKVLIITNGKDTPQIWNGLSGTFADVSWNYPSFVTCGVLATMNGVVIMADITNSFGGGQRNPQNVAWTSFGKVNEWIDDTNGAGEQTLYDTKGVIVQMKPLAGLMAIYAEDSIHLMSYVAGDLVFTFSKVVEDIRLLGGNAVVDLGPYHVFLSQENMLLFDGTAKLPFVADPIHLTYRNEIDTSFKTRAFAVLDRAHRRAYFGVPTGDTTTKVYLLEYDLENLRNWKWSPLNYTQRPLSFGFYPASNSRTWADPAVVNLPWSQDAQRWIDGSQNKDFPLLIMGGTAGRVYLLDDKSFADDGGLYTMIWQSKDFVVPQDYISEYARWVEIEFEAMGSAFVFVNYYTDQGQTQHQILPSIQMTPNWSRYKLPIDIVSQTFRIEFLSQGPGDFQLKWCRPWLRPAGAR